MKHHKKVVRNLAGILKVQTKIKRTLTTGKRHRSSKLTKRQQLMERSSSESEDEAPIPLVSTDDDDDGADEDCIYCNNSKESDCS